MNAFRAQHGHLAVVPHPTPDLPCSTERTMAAGQILASVDAFALAIDGACSAALHMLQAAERGAGDSLDLDRAERAEMNLREATRRYEATLALLRKKHAGMWP